MAPEDLKGPDSCLDGLESCLQGIDKGLKSPKSPSTCFDKQKDNLEDLEGQEVEAAAEVRRR